MLKSMEGVKPEDLALWVTQLKSGDLTNIQRVFDAHADFPKAVSMPWRKSLPHLNDDLLAEANLGLVTAVNNIISKGADFEGTNISGYVTVTIRNAVHRFIQFNPMVRIPRETFLMMKANLPMDREFVFIDLRTAFDYEGDTHPRGSTLMDLCQHLKLDAIDTAIVERLDAGDTQEEAGLIVGMTKCAVNQRLNRIRRRFISDFQYCPHTYRERTQVEV